MDELSGESKHILRWSAVVVILAIVLAFFVYAHYLLTNSSSTNKTSFTLTPGYIFLSLAVGTSSSQHVYLADTTHTLFSDAPFQGVMSSVSHDGSYIVGITGVPGHTGKTRIMQYDIALATSTVLVSDPTLLPRDPQLSPDNLQVVFDVAPATSSTAEAFFIPNQWAIYVAGIGVPPSIVTHGLYPHWSPDGSGILYVGDDGLHLYTIATGADKLVVPLSGGGASARMMFALSNDGTKLAWTNPLHEQINLYKVSWNPFTASPSGTIPDFAFWPVFSPDGTQLAFERVDWSTNPKAQPTNARLDVTDLVTHKTRMIMGLTDFNQMALFVTGWAGRVQ